MQYVGAACLGLRKSVQCNIATSTVLVQSSIDYLVLVRAVQYASVQGGDCLMRVFCLIVEVQPLSPVTLLLEL